MGNKFFNSVTCLLFFHSRSQIWVGQDSVVCIVTGYSVDGLGIESWWRQDFLYPSRLALGSTQPPVQWVLAVFPRVKVAGPRHSALSSAVVNGWVVLC